MIFADADLEAAAAAAPSLVFGNAGQDCCARSRILVERSALDRFMEAFESSVKALRVGDPLDDETEMGPLISASHREKVSSYVEDGAPVAFRGSAPDGPGYWFPPTVLGPVSNDDRAAREEIFGPVAAVIPFEGEDEAIRLANDTDLRPLGLDLDARRREGAPRRARARDGDDLGELEHVEAGADPVRRVQAVGRRPRARPARARLLHRAQERLHRDVATGCSQTPETSPGRRVPGRAVPEDLGKPFSTKSRITDSSRSRISSTRSGSESRPSSTASSSRSFASAERVDEPVDGLALRLGDLGEGLAVRRRSRISSTVKPR